MTDVKQKSFEYLFSNIPAKTNELNHLLLSVSWKNLNFDESEFHNGIKFEITSLTDDQKTLLYLIKELIPEWKRIIGCKQHHTHDYTLDIHTLLVIKKIQETVEYEKLTHYDKLLLLYTALLHDLEKAENEVDPEHPAKSAEKSCSILYRLGFGEEFIDSVYTLIFNHQVLGFAAVDKLKINDHEFAKTIKSPALINLLTIMTISDIKAVKKDEAFFNNNIKTKISQITQRIHQCLRNKS